MQTVSTAARLPLVPAAATRPRGLAALRAALVRERGRHGERGFTLLELMLAVIASAILATIAVSSYRRVVLRMDVTRAISDIGDIQLAITKFDASNTRLPDTLADMGLGGRLDPWGNPYQYLNFANVMGNGKMRKDRNLVPINTDYDLYSSGPDGRSVSPLTAKASRDDIVRANDGRFIGKAEDY